MHEMPLLGELAVIFALAVVVALALARLRLPVVAGLLLTGTIAGPSALGWVSSTSELEAVAELGVVLLLFTIGLEFSLERLRPLARSALLGGTLQVGVTIAIVVATGTLGFNKPLGTAVLYGFAIALSSTAVVLRGLAERGEVDAPHGRFIVGVLIFQDLCVVPMMLLVPLLGGGEAGAVGVAIALALGKAALLVAVVLVAARFVVPRLFALVDATRSREMFVLAVLAICTATAWLSSLVGLSLALGSFLGGMVVADTRFRHRALGDLLPLRDVFIGFFFVSLGMLLDLRVAFERPATVALLLAALLLGKGLLAGVVAILLRFPARVAWLAGIGLAQFGEFGFVLLTTAQRSGVADGEELSPLIAAGVLSMFLAPFLMRLAPHARAGELMLRPLERLLGSRGIDDAAPEHRQLQRHVVLIGYGVAGRLVATALDRLQQRYLVLELNAETVRLTAAEGVPIYYADATSPEALTHAGVQNARAVVVLINDTDAARRIVEAVQRAAPDTPVHLRMRYLTDRERFADLRWVDVVSEEVEAGVETLARLLRSLESPRNLIDEAVAAAREAVQPSARTFKVPRQTLVSASDLGELKIERILIRAGDFGCGRSPIDLDVRQRTGALVFALRRGERLIDDLEPDTSLQANDIVYLVGSTAKVAAAARLLTEGETEPGTGEPG
ncbi:MAG: cation:proton antiporter [Deltaproteobacteria bacterium]|nr:cation:proton antiporter [Deltaproteobacteria bacterium]